ncbi:MAG: hypothetical protein KDM64_16390 [Verrucomicrobiae bacterium]|nr:hypothetical protein [Verrucomicrobiae bacterium]
MKSAFRLWLFLMVWSGVIDADHRAWADAGARESVAQLRTAIERGYSYREVHVVDWAAEWRRHEPRLLAAPSPRAFAEVAGEMLAATRDPHIWLTAGNELVPAFRRDVRSEINVGPALLPSLIQGWNQVHPVVATGEVAPGIGYIAIHSWERKHAPGSLEAAFAALAGMADRSAIIVDVRLNSGGDERLAREFAGCFIRQRAKYAQHVTLDPATGGFSAPVERWVEPTAGRPAYAGRVAVLMGRVNMSSAEAFLLMMRQAPKATLVGGRSYGASGNPQPHPLANGVTVFLPSWKALFPDGTPLETVGIAPTVEVKTTPTDFTRADPVLEKAIEVVRQ